MSMLIKAEPKQKAVEGDVLPPESPRERARNDPMHFARTVAMMPDFDREARGHLIHQLQCGHRRRCYYYHQWTCTDCGTKL